MNLIIEYIPTPQGIHDNALLYYQNICLCCLATFVCSCQLVSNINLPMSAILFLPQLSTEVNFYRMYAPTVFTACGLQ